jgi:hypothetical protein
MKKGLELKTQNSGLQGYLTAFRRAEETEAQRKGFKKHEPTLKAARAT